MKKQAIIGMSALALITSGCSIATTEPDQAAIMYSAGPIEPTVFDQCVDPGQRKYGGIQDQVFTYPAGQRTYVFSDAEDARDIEPITAPTKDNIQLIVQGQLRFELNTDCETLKEFHERIGLKEPDWNAILRTYLEQPLDRAITTATQDLEWLNLYADPSVKAQWEKRVIELLPEYVKQAAGGNYFESFALTLQKPELPEALRDSLLKVQTAIQNTKAQEEENRRIAMEADGIKPLIEQLGPDAYLVLRAIESGKVTFMPIPAGMPLAVNGDR